MEIHEQKTANLYNVMVDSTAARQQPLTLITTTNGFVREGLLDSKISEYEQIIRGYQDGQYIDNRRIGFLYRLDKKSEWRDAKNWSKSNPGLGSIRSFPALAEDVERAKNDSTKLKNLLTKFFNLSETGESHFLDYDDLKDDKTFDIKQLKPRYYLGGFDLSQVNDLTSAAALFRVPNDNNIYVLSMSWMPEDALEAHLKNDKVPYDIWHEKGYLRLCKGNRINYRDVVEWFEELKNDYDIYPYKIGYDRYSASYLVEDLTNLYGADCLVPVAQGVKTLSLPLQHLKADFRKHIINYNNNPLFRWCALNLQVVQDNNGNYNTCKNRNANVRDDAIMALLDAYTVYINELENYNNII